ncbi:MAG: FAD-binding protein [Lachnospiraceae bacterium]|nr:FAD-binding protein [Lachnospiraceae bacterium]
MNMTRQNEIIKTDYLVIGGGMAGLQSAIAAASKGADVVIAEKADTRRSGCGANGNDHFPCYIPECHGDDFELALRQVNMTMDGGPWQDPTMLRLWLSRSYEVVQFWESIGINMRPTGKWNFEGHSVPGNQRYHLKFDGKNQKSALTKAALDRGVRILNKTPICDVLTNEEGRVIGAIGFDISEDTPKLIVFQAKAVLIAAGGASRLYPGITPAYMFNDAGCPADAGTGHALAYRAGARLVNLDMAGGHAGPRYFARGGKGTWIGLTSDINGDCITPYQDKPSRENGDIASDIWPGSYRDRMQAGTGPSYMNCTRTTDEDLDYMLHDAMVSEGIDSITDHLDQRGISLRDSMIEFGSYNIGLSSQGVDIDVHAMSSVPGMFAAGNVMGNVKGSLGGAVIIGMVAGESAADYVKTVEECPVEGHPLIQARLDQCNAILNRSEGAHWKEAASTLQNIMNDYAGIVIRSESMLTAGLTYLRQLKEEAHQNLGASNSHELMRTLEVLDQIDIGEPMFLMFLNRKESRGPHHRADYTYTNMLLNDKFQTVEKTKDGVVLDFRSRW